VGVPDSGIAGSPPQRGEIPASLPDLDSDAVLRRIPNSGPDMLRSDLVTGERRPSSGAFKPDEDGISVFREGVLQAVGLGPSAIVRNPQNVVVRLPVSDVRAVDSLDVVDAAWPSYVEDPDNPCYVAHALIVGWEGLGKKRRRSLQQELARHPNLVFVHG
jgi:hypothetical protein